MNQNTLAENIYGHGGLDQKKDFRDFKYDRIATAPMPFDWTKGVDIASKLPEPIIVENQGGSFSCGGQASRYYLSVLKAFNLGYFERLSARDPYCHIFYPGGGTSIRDLAMYSVNVGIKNEAAVPSYENGQPPSESFMTDKTASNNTPNAPKFKEIGFAYPALDIDSIAQTIRDNDGCILQVSGQNNGTWLTKFPKPPVEKQWSHFLYACGAELINNVKYIKVLNSWGANVGEGGFQYLSEDFFKGAVTNGVVFFDKNLYEPYKPSPTQKTLSWLQKLVIWFTSFNKRFS